MDKLEENEPPKYCPNIQTIENTKINYIIQDNTQLNNKYEQYKIVEPENQIKYDSNNILNEIKNKWNAENEDIMLKYKNTKIKIKKDLEGKILDLKTQSDKVLAHIENMEHTEIENLNNKRSTLINNVLKKAVYHDKDISIWNYIINFFKN
jgi:carboxypeptidase C (cathepsin A)